MQSTRLIRTLATVFLALVGGLAHAHTTTYTAILNGLSESPANASPGTGTATIIFDDHAFTMEVIASFSGLLGTTTASHIHCCTTVPGVSTAGVATVTPSFTGFPLGVTAGSYDHVFDMSLSSGSWNAPFMNANGGPLGAFSALLAGAEAGKAYLNIHTTIVPGGEIRGFLVLAPVPEPAEYALLLAGLLAVGVAARRRRAGDTAHG